ncbi:MAG: enoyl-CoA hydratase-related protein [Planctomycetota bacterium]
MTYQFIQYDLADGLATITLNRPDVLNSFHRPMAAELQAALATAADDAAVRCILLTGAGRAFCAGQDLAEAQGNGPDGSPPPSFEEIVETTYNRTIRQIVALEKPVLCAVNGVAAGAGANLAFACDIVLASSKASFIQSFIKIGLVPDTGGTWFLPRLIGLARAKALTFLGDKITADDAASFGLIWKVYEPDALIAEARKLGLHLATQPTAGIGLTKRALHLALGNSLDAQLQVEKELQIAAGETHDYREGVAAFLEKRPPQFRGN